MNRTNTIFVDKYEYKDVNELLGEIFRRMDSFNYHNNYTPENVKMSVKQYYDIRNYKEDLFMEKDKSYYILCMKVMI